MSPRRSAPPERGIVRVLLVAGAETARILGSELRAGGYDPLFKRVDSEAGLTDALESESPEVVLCEDGLPRLDGPTVLRLVKAVRPDLPVIVVSSLYGESVAAAAMKAGADDFIAQGFLARLVPAVEREIRSARMRSGWEEAAQNLRETEARSNAFMDNSPAPAFLKNEEGRLVYVNRTFERALATTFAELRGKLDSEWLPPEEAARTRENDRKVLETGRTIQVEETVPTPDGLRQWLVFKFPFRDASGSRFVGGVAVDITERKKVEEALRISEDLYRDLMEHSHALVCVHDLEGRILAVNAAAEKNLGYDRQINLGHDVVNIQDILAPESRARFGDYIQRIRRDGTAAGIMIVRTSQGEKHYWEYSNNLRTAGVQSPVVRGVAFDVTSRIRAEEALREARQFSEQIVASAGEGVIVYGEDLRYLIWNQFMEELTGVPRETILGRTPREVEPSIRDPGSWELLNRALSGETVVSPDTPYQNPTTGARGWVSSTYSPHRNAQGEIVGVIGIVEDITERKQAEESLREGQAFLEKAQEVAQMGSWISGQGLDDELVWSRETCRIFGIAPDHFDRRVQTFFSMVHPEDREAVRVAFRAAIAGEQTYSIDHRIVRPDGTVRWVHERADVVRDAGGPVKLVGIVQDITERTRLEEQFLQAQKMEAVGRLAGGVAHDFNNLLTAILGYSDLLLSQLPTGDGMRTDLEEIRKAGERAASLTRQLLAFSRQQMLEPKIIDVNEIVSNIDKLLRRLIGEDIVLVTRLESGLGFVRADPGQLEQVIMNLVVNSRDAMPSGGKLTIETHAVRLDSPLDLGRIAIEPGRYSVLEIRDTGTGMEPSVQARIFEPFFTTKEKGKGTGLGLATAYGIVKQSGGYIACESQPGRGTSFRLYLPESPEAATPEARPSSALPAVAPRTKHTVLLVEDEDGVRRLSRRLLENEGYRVLEAAAGEEAIALAKGHSGPIHLLLTDVVMPGLNGPEVAERVVFLRPEIKVLYMSGYTDTSLARLSAEAPLLQKPFTPEGLASRVSEILSAG